MSGTQFRPRSLAGTPPPPKANVLRRKSRDDSELSVPSASSDHPKNVAVSALRQENSLAWGSSGAQTDGNDVDNLIRTNLELALCRPDGSNKSGQANQGLPNSLSPSPSRGVSAKAVQLALGTPHASPRPARFSQFGGHSRNGSIDSSATDSTESATSATAVFLEREPGQTRHWLRSVGNTASFRRRSDRSASVVESPDSSPAGSGFASTLLVATPEEPISKETLLKAENAKHLLQASWKNMLSYLEMREHRVQDFKEKIAHLQQDSPGRYTAFQIEREFTLPFFEKETARLRERRIRTKLKDFETVVRIGKGGFGDVFLCRHRRDGQVFALKRMKKDHIKKMEKLEHVRTERDVMAKAGETNCPWIVKLESSFQDQSFLYLVMEFLPGGDFRTLISNLGFFPEEEARFYAAEMILAVGYLHRMGFVHRDLKPDNFLVDRHGHVKLADFGLSKAGLQDQYRKTMVLKGPINMRRTFRADTDDFRRMSTNFRAQRDNQRALAYSVVGSPDYMAPELLDGSGYSYSVDWWSMGCIVFELLVGVPPFFGATPEECFANIYNFEACLVDLQLAVEKDESSELSPEAWDLILRILTHPQGRLGSGASDGGLDSQTLASKPSATAWAILQHSFFAGLPLAIIRQSEPPFVPNLEADDDLTYFEEPEESEEADEDPKAAADTSAALPATSTPSSNKVIVDDLMRDRGSFIGFTYRSPKKDSPSTDQNSN